MIEIDGPEHREPLWSEADRRRDARLRLDGYEVLRFTDAEVAEDMLGVVADIQRLIQARRLSTPDGDLRLGE